MPDHRKLLQIIGFGPAGVGFLVSADREKKLETIISQGISVIDAGSQETIGCGSLDRYEINSNSAARDFTDLISKAGIFKSLWETPNSCLSRISCLGNSTVPLKWVAQMQQELSTVLVNRIQNDPSGRSNVIINCKVSRLDYDTELSTWTSYDDKGKVICSSRYVLVSIGASQTIQKNITKSFFSQSSSSSSSSSSLQRWNSKTFLSDSLLTSKSVNHMKGSKSIVILGASHSAFSVAWKLLKECGETLGPGAIKIMYRSANIKIYYASVAEARRNGYSYFDPNKDVCPKTGAVHRFGGLREDARKLYEDIYINKCEDRVVLVPISSSPHNHNSLETFHQVLDECDFIVQAFGYQPKNLNLTQDGVPFKLLLRESNNQVYVDDEGYVFKDEVSPKFNKDCNLSFDARVPGFLAAGLGYGITASETNGGEPSFRESGKSIDGINMYQGVVGSLLLRRIVKK